MLCSINYLTGRLFEKLGLLPTVFGCEVWKSGTCATSVAGLVLFIGQSFSFYWAVLSFLVHLFLLHFYYRGECTPYGIHHICFLTAGGRETFLKQLKYVIKAKFSRGPEHEWTEGNRGSEGATTHLCQVEAINLQSLSS